MPNQVHVYGHSDQATFHVEDHQPGSSIARFMAEQVQQILSLIQIPKSSHEKLLGKRIWLLDLGASCHMTSVLSCYKMFEIWKLFLCNGRMDLKLWLLKEERFTLLQN